MEKNYKESCKSNSFLFYRVDFVKRMSCAILLIVKGSHEYAKFKGIDSKGK